MLQTLEHIRRLAAISSRQYGACAAPIPLPETAAAACASHGAYTQRCWSNRGVAAGQQAASITWTSRHLCVDASSALCERVRVLDRAACSSTATATSCARNFRLSHLHAQGCQLAATRHFATAPARGASNIAVAEAQANALSADATRDAAAYAHPPPNAADARPPYHDEVPQHDSYYVPRLSPYAAQSAIDRIEKQAVAKFSKVDQSVKKINLVAKLVRRLHVDDAVIQLAMVNKKLAARNIMQAIITARNTARLKNMALQHLVVDELVVLKHATRPRKIWYRAKGGASRIQTHTSHLYVRLREVPGARMKTIVRRPWFERRYKHRRDMQQEEDLH